MRLSTDQTKFITKYRDNLSLRSRIIEYFTITDLLELEISNTNIIKQLAEGNNNFLYITTTSNIHPGDIVKKTVHGVVVYIGIHDIDGDRVSIVRLSDSVGSDRTNDINLPTRDIYPPLSFYDTFDIKNGDIENYTEDKSITTTIGRYLLNYVILARPLKDAIPYVNTEWVADKIEKMLSNALIENKITPTQVNSAIDGGFMIGHFTELCVPSLTEKSMTTHPDVDKTKKELLELHKKALEEGDPSVIADIESKLVALDKEWLEGDPANRFLIPLGGKMVKLNRRKMFLTVGGIEDFNKGVGSYNFVANSLSDGWDTKDFSVIANESRKGSFNRGHETMRGGALTKQLSRIFQDLEFLEEDCGTNVTYTADFNKLNIMNFIGRYIVENGSLIKLTKENYVNFDKKVVKLRTPMGCRSKNGLCYTCCGDVYKKLQAKAISMYITALTSTFTTLSLKSMHGTTIELMDINPEEYVIM